MSFTGTVLREEREVVAVEGEISFHGEKRWPKLFAALDWTFAHSRISFEILNRKKKSADRNEN